MFVVEVVGYGEGQIDEEKFAREYDVYTVYGWSDVVINYIKSILKEKTKA